MFCRQCGNQVPEGAAFCNACGTPIATQKPVVTEEPPMAEPTVAVAPPIVVEPVLSETPEPCENPLIANLKRHHTGGLFLAAIIAYTVALFCQLIYPLTTSYNIPAYLASSDKAATLFSVLGSLTTVTTWLAAIPILLVVIGLWVFYGQSHSRESRATTGLTLIKTSVLIRLVCYILALVLFVVALLFGMFAIDALIDSKYQSFESEMDGYRDQLSDYDSYADSAVMGHMASFGGSVTSFDDSFENAQNELDEMEEQAASAVQAGRSAITLVFIVLLVFVVIAFAIPIAYYACILSSIRSLKETLILGTFAPRALGVVQVFNWIIAICGIVSMINALITPAILQGLLETLGNVLDESIPLTIGTIHPLTMISSLCQSVAYILFALSIGKYKNLQQTA